MTTQPQEEETFDFQLGAYSLKQPGADDAGDEPFQKLLLDSIIDEFKTGDFSQTADAPEGANPPAAHAQSPVEHPSEGSRANPVSRNVRRITSVFWKTSGSQVLGMSMFVVSYFALSFFQVL